MDWCPWQPAVLAVGGGMEDGHLRVLDVNTGQNMQTPTTDSQVNTSAGVCLHFGLLEPRENDS